jgi:hypothetical protein
MESKQGLIIGTSSRIRTEIYLFLEPDPEPDPSSILHVKPKSIVLGRKTKTQD